MKLRQSIINLKEKTKNSKGRFPVSFANIVMFFILLLFSVWTEELNDNVAKLILLSICSGVFSATAVLFCECNFTKNEKLPKFISIGCISAEVILFVLSFILDYTDYIRSLTGIIIASLAISFYFITKRGKSLSYMADSIKNTAFSALISSVILVGGLICIFAFDALVYSNFNFTDKIIYTLLSFCASIAAALILVYLPSVSSCEEKPGKGYKGVIVYAGLSIYFLLSAILYLYIIKILIPAELPSGGVNPFVTIASAAYIFFIFAAGVFEEDTAYVKFFMKIGGYLMIPLVTIQCIALGIRVWHYGFTSARVLSVCFIIVTVLFIVGAIFRKKIGLGLPCIITAVVALVVTCTPISYDNIALWNQNAILENSLEESGMLKNGVLDLSTEISNDHKKNISSAYRYIIRNSDTLPEYIDESVESQFDELFNNYYISDYDEDYNAILWCNYDSYFAQQTFDISNYSGILYYENYLAEECKVGEGLYINCIDGDGNEQTYNIEDYIRALYTELGDGYIDNNTNCIIQLDENTDMYYDNIYFNYNSASEVLTDIGIEGYLLFK